jgi:hypothetical protein
MEQVVLQLQNSTARKKLCGVDANIVKEFGDLGNKTLKSFTRWMVPSTFFTSIAQLLGYENRNVQRKVNNIPYKLFHDDILIDFRLEKKCSQGIYPKRT